MTPRCHFTITHNNEWFYTDKLSVFTQLNSRYVSVPFILCQFRKGISQCFLYYACVIIIAKHPLCHMTDRTREVKKIRWRYLYICVSSSFLIFYQLLEIRCRYYIMQFSIVDWLYNFRWLNDIVINSMATKIYLNILIFNDNFFIYI